MTQMERYCRQSHQSCFCFAKERLIELQLQLCSGHSDLSQTPDLLNCVFSLCSFHSMSIWRGFIRVIWLTIHCCPHSQRHAHTSPHCGEHVRSLNPWYNFALCINLLYDWAPLLSVLFGLWQGRSHKQKADQTLDVKPTWQKNDQIIFHALETLTIYRRHTRCK